ncbi:aliphatic sulfonates family ABC transporter, periplasmic ligand-binding protein [Thermocrinis albus DSM 14484]|uniref:Putative aliphatic sulfonates-binding protein n=1 Tax=Thermocrinis albus (strain DSM 14484 / JCM 11386 / HI 11/12) TaxID=638303 RepID=D3SQA9_THEAH|nr:ABC transporter substrate-binding protein [Thermocrinis albus]ADC89346.1 aliphatic sulfonates family ABC transporter, periplasmic ligand-binding protein [Thermocrinis albus DSM 14484]
MLKEILTTIIMGLILTSLGFAGPIKLGVSDWPGWVAWYIAKEKGFFKSEGINVELVWFSTYSDSISAFASGQLDANSQTLSDTIPLASKGMKIKVILVNDNSNGNDAIVAKNYIKTINDLRGKKVAVEVGAIDHFFLLYVLQKYGLTEKDVQIINMTTQDAAVALLEGKVDAAAVWEPWISRIVKSKQAHVLISSKDTPGLIPDILVVHEESLKKNYNEYVKLARVWFRTVEFIKNNPSEAASIMAKVLNIKKDDVLYMLKGIKFFGVQENALALYPENKNNPLSLYRSGDLLNKYLLKFGFTNKEANLSNLIYDRVVRDATKR